MAKRDPDKSARNRLILNIKAQLRMLLPDVLNDTGLTCEASLNAKIGSKHDDFFDLKNDVINSPDEFINKWLLKLNTAILNGDSSSKKWIWEHLNNSDSFKRYVSLFLKRSYLKHYYKLSKIRPKVEDAEIWIGQNNAEYGLLITPRYKNGKWENDKSEIRAFEHGYWTIGHALSTGFLIPKRGRKHPFESIEHFLNFFQDTLVRNSGSEHEYEIADCYCNFVRSSANPADIPMLIPEYRYLGLNNKHKYRLDFLIINPYTQDKVGFELSPWSTHGYLSKTKSLTQAEINEMARDNFEKEMKKHRDYFKKYGIFTLIYTDEYLNDCQKLFNEEIKPYLEPEKPETKISFHIMEKWFL